MMFIDLISSLTYNMFQLVLNGNNVAWSTVIFLVKKLVKLDELHLSANNLGDPEGNLVLEVGSSQHSLSFILVCFRITV